MTPQERELLTNLVNRLRQAPAQHTDPEAESMIADLVADKPDTPYVLAQTVLIQDYALHQAQARINDLEQQLKGQPKQEHGGFLSAIFGSGKPAQPRPQGYAQPGYAPQPSYSQPQPPAYAAPPAYAPPSAGPWGAPQPFVQTGQPSFLRSAATTAAGIAGGALLFEGIESLMGGHGGFGGGYGSGFGGAGFGGFGPQPGITETVVNNYYGDGGPGAGGADAAFPQADFPDSGPDQGGFTDAGFDDGNFDTGGDFGGGGDDFSSDV
jgi:hypothetical protein